MVCLAALGRPIRRDFGWAPLKDTWVGFGKLDGGCPRRPYAVCLVPPGTQVHGFLWHQTMCGVEGQIEGIPATWFWINTTFFSTNMFFHRSRIFQVMSATFSGLLTPSNWNCCVPSVPIGAQGLHTSLRLQSSVPCLWTTSGLWQIYRIAKPFNPMLPSYFSLCIQPA